MRSLSKLIFDFIYKIGNLKYNLDIIDFQVPIGNVLRSLCRLLASLFPLSGAADHFFANDVLTFVHGVPSS